MSLLNHLSPSYTVPGWGLISLPQDIAMVAGLDAFERGLGRLIKFITGYMPQ